MGEVIRSVSSQVYTECSRSIAQILHCRVCLGLPTSSSAFCRSLEPGIVHELIEDIRQQEQVIRGLREEYRSNYSDSEADSARFSDPEDAPDEEYDEFEGIEDADLMELLDDMEAQEARQPLPLLPREKIRSISRLG